jgi:hypothetical protein
MEICLLYTYEPNGGFGGGDGDELGYGCGSSFRDSIRALGHTATTFSIYHKTDDGTGMHRLINSISAGYRPAVVFLMHAGSLQMGLTDLWDRSNFLNIPMIAEGGDEWQCFKYNFPHNRKSDLVLTCDNEASFAYRQHGVSAEWFPVWADERVFFNDNRERTLGISSTAVPTAVRNERGFLHINDKLAQHFGENFQNPMRHRQGLGYIPMMENGDLFRRSKVVFQFSSSGEMTRRIVEGAACGAVVVTDRLSTVRNIQSLFIEDKNIVFYESAEECIDKIENLLNNDTRRQEIASAMEKRILRKHTGLARAKNFVEHVENYFGRY